MKALNLLERCVASLLAPPRCALCDALGTQLACPSCADELPWYDAPPPPLDALPVFAAWRYDEPVARAVRRLKYEDRPDLAGPLAQLALSVLREQLAPVPELFVPVPLHPSRLGTRGYNQAALLARAFAAAHRGARVAPHALRRRVATGQLAGVGRAERERRVAEAFVARPRAGVAGRRVLVVDDVVTSGATAGACAVALERAGARVVGVLALCRTV